MADKIRRDYYKIWVPEDFGTAEERAELAINEARERARLYVMPCNWEARDVGNGKFLVVRTRRASTAHPLAKPRRKFYSWRVEDHFDVWGNSEEGWQVNDSRDAGTIKLPENPTDAEIAAAMRAAGHLRKGLHTSSLEIGGDDINITLDEADSLYPLFSLNRKD